MKIRKSTTFALGESHKDVETPRGVSMTVPDQTMPLKVLLDRHSRGLEIPTYKPQYSDEEYPDLKRLDLSEIQEFKENTKEYINDLKQQQKQAIEEKRKKQAAPIVPDTPSSDPKIPENSNDPIK